MTHHHDGGAFGDLGPPPVAAMACSLVGLVVAVAGIAGVYLGWPLPVVWGLDAVVVALSAVSLTLSLRSLHRSHVAMRALLDQLQTRGDTDCD